MRPKWYPEWRGEDIVIVASGPTAATVPLEIAKGRARFIAVNNSWKLCPWADILFAGDYKWWEIHGGCPEFPGLKVTIDRRAAETQDWNICRLRSYRSDGRISSDLGFVGGSYSGFNAVNLAVQLAPSRILLVGYDMTLMYGVHWHGLHPVEMKNPWPGKVEQWCRALDGAAGAIAKLKIQVINCSSISALKRYPKMSFREALDLDAASGPNDKEGRCRALEGI